MPELLRSLRIGILAVALGGCAAPAPVVTEPPPPVDYWLALERADVHEGVSPDTGVVGRLQKVIATEEDTFPDIARRFNVGYAELAAANPGVDPWLPGEGTEILLPTAHVIPDTPRRGIVINLPSMRLWWFGEPDAGGAQTVITHPIGIGRVGWETPLGETRVVSKAADPTWYPPASVREEHAAAGDPLPPVVPPGPDNPLGSHAMRLALPGYLIHGTNKPWGVGMRVSHGCIRLYPEDVAVLFDYVRPGMPVTLVDQPWLAAEQDGELVLEVHPVLEDSRADWSDGLRRIYRVAGDREVSWERVGYAVTRAHGVPVPIEPGTAEDAWFRRAPVVPNEPRGNYADAAESAGAAPASGGAGGGP